MEAILLAGVIQTDTHKRLQVAEQLNDYFSKDDSSREFPEFDRLVEGLATWMSSSNFKVEEALYFILMEAILMSVTMICVCRSQCVACK